MKYKFGIFLGIMFFFSLKIAYSYPAPDDTLSWDFIMSQKWERPAKLDSFVNVHPRLFLSKALVESLQQKINTTHADIWNAVREKAESYIGQPPPLEYNKEGEMRSAGRGIPWQALAYLLTKDPRYLKGARKWITAVCGYPVWENNKSLGAGECLFGLSIGYDWLYDYLSAEEKEIIRTKLIYQAELMASGPPAHHDLWLANHNHVEHNGLAAAGFVLFDKAPEAIDWIRQADLVFSAMLQTAGHDGSSTEGHQYWAYTTESSLRYFEAAKTLLGKDYYDNDWLRNAANFIIFSAIPDFDSDDCVMYFGDAHKNYASHGPSHILYRLASEYNNGYAQYLAQEMDKRHIGRGDYCTWLNLLWYDDKVRPVPLSHLPAFWHFDDIGWITSRSGWENEAVMVGFKCSPLHGMKVQPFYDKQFHEKWDRYHTINGGHGHPDVNSFQIYAYGKRLVIDPEYEKPKWTKTHSTLLVNGVGQLGEGLDWFDRNAVVGAGAKSSIIKATNNSVYDYIIGDAGNIYPRSTGLTKFIRHFIYIKPDIIVIVDEINAARDAQFDWRLVFEGDIQKQNERLFELRNKDVNMDIHLLLPDAFSTSVKGNVLSVLPDRTNETIAVTVLHPRKQDGPASRARVTKYRNSKIHVEIQIKDQKTDVQLDLAGREELIRRID